METLVYVLKNEKGEFARLDDNHKVFWHPEFRTGGFGTWGSCSKEHMEKMAKKYGGNVISVLDGYDPDGNKAIQQPSHAITF